MAGRKESEVVIKWLGENSMAVNPSGWNILSNY